MPLIRGSPNDIMYVVLPGLQYDYHGNTSYLYFLSQRENAMAIYGILIYYGNQDRRKCHYIY